ncbi:uncharacterized protein LOC133705803 [Populus nigra]|uniref:uncharacterized protein LOC133705803 n=1 Tax=Populus nigra TaxID=3691 RepID=UPI002B26A545|nr:uncharacterized protein LOC133705803 [Populus nigra]
MYNLVFRLPRKQECPDIFIKKRRHPKCTYINHRNKEKPFVNFNTCLPQIDNSPSPVLEQDIQVFDENRAVSDMTLENQDQNKKSFLRKLILQKEVRGRKAEEVSFDSSDM